MGREFFVPTRTHSGKAVNLLMLCFFFFDLEIQLRKKDTDAQSWGDCVIWLESLYWGVEFLILQHLVTRNGSFCLEDELTVLLY